MRFVAETDGNEHDVEIVRDVGRVFASVDGRKYELEASEPEAGVYLFKKDGKIFEAFVSALADPNEPTIVRLKDKVHEIRIIDPKKLRGSGADGENSSGLAEIKTAMPGKVVRILVSLNDTVAKGDGVIVVEAMKMQNEMRSPKDGTITDIKVREGDTVAAGDVLLVIE